MKRTSYIIKSLFMLMIMSMTISFISCQNDDVLQSQDKERGVIIMNIDKISTRAGNSLFTGDEQVERVRFFVFTGQVLEKNQLFVEGNTSFSNPFVLDVATGVKDIYVIANESAGLTASLEEVTSKGALFSLLADETSSSLSIPLVMTGMAENVQVTEQGAPNHNEVAVTLYRVAVKVSLQLKKGDMVNKDVEITKVSLLSNAGKTTLFPTPPSTATVTPQSYWDFTKTVTSWTLTSTLASNTELGDIYLYENSTQGDKTHATQLEIEALYNSIPSTYRVYLNENVVNGPNLGDPSSSETDPSDHLYALKRGHHYRVNGTIVSMGEFDGLIHSTNVLPWDILESNVLYDRVFTILPHPTVVDHIYAVANPTDLVTFTFKLSDPIGSTWNAQLSNPYDFEFSTSGGAVSAGGLGTEYTISIKPRQAQSAAEKSTEFYITVNGVEIPLLQSSVLVGTGNRIVIKQPAE